MEDVDTTTTTTTTPCAGSGAAPDTEPPKPEAPQAPRLVFISASKLAHSWRRVDPALLDDSLMLFGSKRSWLFPTNAVERAEAKRQPGRYHLMDRAFLALIAAKDEKGQVHFLKKPSLAYEIYPGPADPEAYDRVSDWLEGLGYNRLQLSDAYWKSADPSSFKHSNRPTSIIRNYVKGYHEYDELMELLIHSDSRLVPAMSTPPTTFTTTTAPSTTTSKK